MKLYNLILLHSLSMSFPFLNALKSVVFFRRPAFELNLIFYRRSPQVLPLEFSIDLKNPTSNFLPYGIAPGGRFVSLPQQFIPIPIAFHFHLPPSNAFSYL